MGEGVWENEMLTQKYAVYKPENDEICINTLLQYISKYLNEEKETIFTRKIINAIAQS